MKKIFLTVLAGFVASATAHASISFLGNPVITGSAGDYGWSYTPTLDTGESLTATVPGGSCDTPSAPIEGSTPNCGSFFTIYDVVGYIPGSAFAPDLGTDWAISVQMTGLTPSTVLPTDGSADNITFYYIGDSALTGTGQTLGDFGFQSDSNIVNINGWYTYQTNSTGTPPDQGDGHLWVPADATDAAPEPAGLALFGTAIAGLGLLRRRFHH